MFGFLARWFGPDTERPDPVLLAIRQAQRDLEASNPEYLRGVQERITQAVREHAAAQSIAAATEHISAACETVAKHLKTLDHEKRV